MISPIYKKNIEALNKNQYNLVEMLEKINLIDEKTFRIVDGKKGHKVLQVRNQNGKYINYNSAYDPYKEATKVASQINSDINRSMVVAVGVGLGYHLKEITNKLNQKSLILAVEENKSVLKSLLHDVDFSEEIEDERIFFATGRFEGDSLKDQLSNWIRELYPNTFSIQPVILPISDIGYIRFSKEVFRVIQELKDRQKFLLGNDVDDTLLGVYNRIQNLSHIIKNPGIRDFIRKFKDVYKGKPAIIISSGPSLDKNIHLLKSAKGKALLLSCDGSMSALEKHGIVPDAVSSVERIMLTYKAFYKDVRMPDETVLIAPAVVRPEIFKSFNTKTLSNFKSEGISAWFNTMTGNKGHIWAGVSVAHHLLGLAAMLEADPIILVGQDLAYSPLGVSHVNEASVKEKVDVNKVDIYVKDISGEDIPTTFVWKQFKEVFEYAIGQYKLNCIDATEGGAYIKGTTIMSLEETISTYCNSEVMNFRQLIDSIEIEESFIKETHINTLKGLTRLTKKFYLLKKKVEKSKNLNIKAREILDIGIQTEEELEKVYEAIEYTENKIVKYLRKDPGMYMFFQYHIMLTVFHINQLGTEVTFDVLSKNLEIQYELLENIYLYTLKMLNVLDKGLDDFKNDSKLILDEKNLDEYSVSKYL